MGLVSVSKVDAASLDLGAVAEPSAEGAILDVGVERPSGLTEDEIGALRAQEHTQTASIRPVDGCSFNGVVLREFWDKPVTKVLNAVEHRAV